MMKLIKSISIYFLLSVIGYCLMANTPLSTENKSNTISVTTTKDPIWTGHKPTPIKKTITHLQQATQARITFTTADLIYNPSVGNEWTVWIEANGRNYYRGDSFTVTQGETIRLNALDEDPSHDDLGTTNIKISSTHINNGQIRESVFVKEHHGRGAGKTAEWELTLQIESI